MRCQEGKENSVMQLSNQVALVTGAGQGIGKASALALAAAGANVVAVDINDRKRSMRRRRRSPRRGAMLAIEADIGSVSDIDRMVTEAMAAFGKIDILVNNAGVTRRAYIMDLTEEDWDRIHRVNSKGVFFCLQRVAREMIPRRSGRIINIASIAGKGFPGTSNAIYAASKGAVISLTKTAAQQLGRTTSTSTPCARASCAPRLYMEIVRDMAEKEGLGAEEIERRARRGRAAQARQRARGHRRHGGVPGLAGCPQHHRPVLQRRWRLIPD